jgi:hypothetical protein
MKGEATKADYKPKQWRESGLAVKRMPIFPKRLVKPAEASHNNWKDIYLE